MFVNIEMWLYPSENMLHIKFGMELVNAKTDEERPNESNLLKLFSSFISL